MSSNIYNIYLIRNRINDHTYVGRTIRSLKERLTAHFSSAIYEPKGLLHEAINRYGKENFTIESQPCPREYRVTRTHLLFEKCELDYGGKFVLKDNEG